MNNHRTAITMFLAVFLFLTCLMFDSCGIIEPSQSKTALNQLLASLKEVPPPIVTEANSEIPGLQKTLRDHGFADAWRGFLANLFKEIRDEWPTPERTERLYTWMFDHSDGESTIRFELAAEDSMYISIYHDGPAYTGWRATPFHGWYNRDMKQGRMTRGSDEFFWREVSEGFAIGGDIAGMGIGVLDSTDGGGLLETMELVTGQITFRAGWDGFGHGWCIGYPGPGEW
ncbi:hypothetical protein ACFL41_00625 [Gemmatimonadota bacterium]